MDADIEGLSAALGTALKSRRLRVATAESCTGGWLSEAITATAGSSEWFERGYVTYSNAAKQESLGVTEGTLARFGAVSEEVAREMALGVIDRSHAEVAATVTGIAGPSGGTATKPVGTVCFAWYRVGKAPITLTVHFDGTREQVRRQSVLRALRGLLDILDSN